MLLSAVFNIHYLQEKKNINPSKDTLFFKGETQNVRQVICIISHRLDLNVGLLTSFVFQTHLILHPLVRNVATVPLNSPSNSQG